MRQAEENGRTVAGAYRGNMCREWPIRPSNVLDVKCLSLARGNVIVLDSGLLSGRGGIRGLPDMVDGRITDVEVLGATRPIDAKGLENLAASKDDMSAMLVDVKGPEFESSLVAGALRRRVTIEQINTISTLDERAVNEDLERDEM